MSKSNSFHVGKVTGYLRSRVWHLCYFENGKRRPRAGVERDAARQLAAQVNSQLETGALRAVVRADQYPQPSESLARTPRTGTAVPGPVD